MKNEGGEGMTGGRENSWGTYYYSETSIDFIEVEAARMKIRMFSAG